MLKYVLGVMVMLQVPFPLLVIKPTPSSLPQFPTTANPKGLVSFPIPACMYTAVGFDPIVLQVALAKEAVIVIWSVALKVAGETVACENPTYAKSESIRLNKIFFFIVWYLR